MLIDNLGHSGTSVDFQYVFVDLDKDGQDELLIGKQDYISTYFVACSLCSTCWWSTFISHCL